jgi:hypothetical protein
LHASPKRQQRVDIVPGGDSKADILLFFRPTTLEQKHHQLYPLRLSVDSVA